MLGLLVFCLMLISKLLGLGWWLIPICIGLMTMLDTKTKKATKIATKNNIDELMK